MTNLDKTFMGLLTEHRIFMKFSPAYDNENISQCANIILRHDRWVDTQVRDSPYAFKNEHTQLFIYIDTLECLSSMLKSSNHNIFGKII